MLFEEFSQRVESQIDELYTSGYTFFQASVTKEKMWDTYLGSFTEGYNDIFRVRTHHDSNYDKSFVVNIGRLIAIKDGVRKSIWPDVTGDEVYGPVSAALNQLVMEANIDCIFITKERRFGHEPSLDNHDTNIVWNHFLCEVVPDWRARRRQSLGDVREQSRVDARLFLELVELGHDLLNNVLLKAESNTVYRLQERAGVLNTAKRLASTYANTREEFRSDWIWETAHKTSNGIVRLINTSVGELLKNIRDGHEDPYANYERMLDPSRYQRLENKRVSERQLAEAKAFLQENGYMGSLQRRHAVLDDLVPGQNALFIDSDVIGGQRAADIFDQILENQEVDVSKVKARREMTIDEFVADILPDATKLEILLENRHTNNMVSLVAPADKNAPSIMKWDNGFTHVYEGGYADAMQRRVVEEGGKVDGEMRFSIMWSDEIYEDALDLDAHCVTPQDEIYYGQPVVGNGSLDVDITNPRHNRPAVENITWPFLKDVRNGTYRFFVRNFNGRSLAGFRAQIAIKGTVYHYNYSDSVEQGSDVQVATVRVSGGAATITHHLTPVASAGAADGPSIEKWGIGTKKFHEVSALMLSPNFWGDEGVGNKHFIFTLKGARNKDSFRGFTNEYLHQDLRPYRKVMDNLADLITVQDTDDQLAGVGASTTTDFEIKVRVNGDEVVNVRMK